VGEQLTQYAGYHRNPDDLVGLLIGPLFIVAEGGFLLGLRPALRAEIEQGVGPTRSGSPALAASGPKGS